MIAVGVSTIRNEKNKKEHFGGKVGLKSLFKTNLHEKLSSSRPSEGWTQPWLARRERKSSIDC
jgi:hypothetical protein